MIRNAPELGTTCAQTESSSYRMTLSALASSDGGIVRPRVLAVLRLSTNSNFVGCSMGRSPGFAPLVAYECPGVLRLLTSPSIARGPEPPKTRAVWQATYRRLHSYPGGPNCAPAEVTAMSLIELNP